VGASGLRRPRQPHGHLHLHRPAALTTPASSISGLETNATVGRAASVHAQSLCALVERLLAVDGGAGVPGDAPGRPRLVVRVWAAIGTCGGHEDGTVLVAGSTRIPCHRAAGLTAYRAIPRGLCVERAAWVLGPEHLVLGGPLAACRCRENDARYRLISCLPLY
jgi:hypothetical protein